MNKMAYGYSQHSCPWSMCPFEGRILGSEPERGDVVVFRHPTNGTDFIKRLIGLPGDEIQMQAGVLYINGEAAPQVPAGTFTELLEPQGPMRASPACQTVTDGECHKERFIETLPNGVEHNILNIRTQSTDSTPVYVVPEDHYFFMGDNRDNSGDSRNTRAGGVGFVHEDFLIGRADRIMFSSAGRSLFFFWTWRADRFFMAIE